MRRMLSTRRSRMSQAHEVGRHRRVFRIEGLEPRLAMNGTWATPAGTLSLDSNLNLWITNNSSTPALVAQNVEQLKVASGSDYVAFVESSGALERFNTSQPTVGPIQLASQVGSYPVDPIQESASPSGNLSLAGDFSWSIGIVPSGDEYSLDQNGSLQRFAANSNSPTVIGSFTAGSSLAIDGTDSPVVLDRGNNHLYRYIVGSNVWSDIGNFAAGSPLIVDGSGDPEVLDRGNNHLYRYIVGSNVWSDIGNFAAGSPLIADGSGDPEVLDRGTNHLLRYIVGSNVWSDIGNFAPGSSLVVDGTGSPLVLDSGSGQLLRYAAGSNTATVVGAFTSSSAMVVDGSGSVFILNSGSGALYRYASGSVSSTKIDNYAANSSIALGDAGSVLIRDSQDGSLYRYADGSSSSTKIQFEQVTATTGIVGQPYVGRIVIDGVGNDATHIVGNLPAGLKASLSGATITIDGTPPTKSGVYSVNVSVSLASGIPWATVSASYALTLNPGSTTTFVISAPGTVGTGVPFTVGVSAFDQYANPTHYTGTVSLSSNSPSGLPTQNIQVTNGSGSIVLTPLLPGQDTLTFTDQQLIPPFKKTLSIVVVKQSYVEYSGTLIAYYCPPDSSPIYFDSKPISGFDLTPGLAENDVYEQWSEYGLELSDNNDQDPGLDANPENSWEIHVDVVYTDGPTDATVVRSTQLNMVPPVVNEGQSPVIVPGTPSMWSNSGAVALAGNGTITDSGGDIASMIVALDGPQTGDVLFGADVGNITVSGNGTSSLTLSGADSAEDYQTALQLITYSNTIGAPDLPAETAEISAVDVFGEASNTATATINIDPTPPIVDLNGALAGVGFCSTWAGAAVNIIDDANATVVDQGSATLQGAIVTLTNPAVGDILAANTMGTAITQSYSSGTLSLMGSDSVADYQQVLRTITYNNTLGSPGVAQESAIVVVNDGIVNSAAATSTINMPAPSLALTAGAGSGTPNFSTSWYNQGSIPVENNVLATVTALSGVPTLSSLTVTLATFHTGDVLSLAPLGGVSLSLTSSYTAGTLTLSGTDTVGHYQQALRFINYNNTVGGPGATPIVATFVANDGTHASDPVTSTININVGSGQVLGNRLFYNNSKYDVNNGAINANDDLAIASDKTGYNGTGTATFANVSAFNKGITGIMVDLQSGLGTHTAITAGDISFKVSPATFVTTTYNQLSTWSAGPAPAAVSVRIGAGQGGSDRLEITFGTGVVKQEWLEVNVHSGGNTGLSANDVFYFGSIIGDSGAADTVLLAKTDGNDYNVPFNNIIGLTTPVWNLADYTKDGKIDGNDATAAIGNVFTLHYLANPTGPFAPNGGGSAAPAASPAATPTGSAVGTPSPLSSATGTIMSGLSFLKTSELNSSSIPSALQYVSSSPPVTKAIQTVLHNAQILQAVEQIAGDFNVHDDALDGLLRDLGIA